MECEKSQTDQFTQVNFPLCWICEMFVHGAHDAVAVCSGVTILSSDASLCLLQIYFASGACFENTHASRLIPANFYQIDRYAPVP